MTSGGFDDLDRALLHALQIDGRAPFSRIGAVLGVSDQTAARRYARLRGEGLLRVVALTDHEAVKHTQWTVRVRATPKAAGQVADALARRTDMSWVSLCSGGTEIFAAAYGPDIEPLLLEVIPRTEHILDVAAQQVLHVYYGGSGEPFTKRGPLDEWQTFALSEHLPDPVIPPASLDAVDGSILDTLRHDGRATIEQLVAATAASPSTVRRRLHALRAGGVFHLDVDADLGLFNLPVRARLLLNVDVAELDMAGRTLATHPEVAYAAATTGASNLVASISTRDTADLHRYLTTAVASLPGIGAVETVPVLRQVKAAVGRYHSTRSR